MPFVVAKCTNCGAVLSVDNTKDAWICNYCQTPFIVEKAINNYHVTNYNNINANTVNFYGGKESDFVIRGGVLEKYTGESREVVIPDNVVKIGYRVFSGLPITSVKIPDSVKEICDCAFQRCGYLTSLVIPDSVTVIGSYSFADCKSLESVKISNNVKSICHAFENCASLTSVDIPSGVTNIYAAFQDCLSLTSVNVPDSVTSIDFAFWHCTSLISVTIPDNVTSIGFAFQGCTSLKSIKIPDSIKKIEYHEFDNCYDLTDIDYPYLKEFADSFPAIAERQKNGLCIYCGGKISLFGKCKSCGRKN